MPSLVLHPDTSFAGNPGRVPEALEVRVGDGVIYALMPSVPIFIDSAHLSAVQTAVTTAGGSLAAAAAPTPTATNTLATPGAPTSITQGGTAGTTSYSYAVVATDANGDSIQGAALATSTGNAVLSGTNFNTVSWAGVTGATGYKVIRTASAGTPATVGLIATLGNVLTANDTGLAATAYTNPVSYSYQIVASNDQGDAPPSTATAVNNAPTLNAGRTNVITWAAVPNADNYRIIRSASAGTPSSTGLIGTVAASAPRTFTDNGIAATVYTPSATNPPNWGSSRIQVEV